MNGGHYWCTVLVVDFEFSIISAQTVTPTWLQTSMALSLKASTLKKNEQGIANWPTVLTEIRPLALANEKLYLSLQCFQYGEDAKIKKSHSDTFTRVVLHLIITALLWTAYYHDFYLNLEIKTNSDCHTSVVKSESQFTELKTIL